MEVETLKTAISTALPTTAELADVSGTKTAVIAGIAGVAVGGTLGAIAGTAIAKRKNSKKRKKNKKRKSSNRKKRNNADRKSRSTKRIKYTKNGQPYVLMASGKARFISKRGAKMSKKRKGGRY